MEPEMSNAEFDELKEKLYAANDELWRLQKIYRGQTGRLWVPEIRLCCQSGR